MLAGGCTCKRHRTKEKANERKREKERNTVHMRNEGVWRARKEATYRSMRVRARVRGTGGGGREGEVECRITRTL